MSQLSIFSRNSLQLIRVAQKSHLLPAPNAVACAAQVRFSKHWIPKWKKLRGQKFIKVELPNLNEKVEDLTDEEIRSRMKERGLQPARPWMERPFSLTSTTEIFEAYVPPEGDGKMSAVSKDGAKQVLELFGKKSKSYLAVRKIRNYEDDFEAATFLQKAQDIYLRAHQALMDDDRHKLRENVTARAYPEMRHNTRLKTIRWRFIKSLEAPRIVHARCTSLIEKENMFGQVTVRFHTQQTLAVYDRFGRLVYGSEFIPKDVLEFVVFEKHLANEYGEWKLHGKIIPDWMPERTPATKTFVVQPEEEQEPVPDAVAVADEEKSQVAEAK